MVAKYTARSIILTTSLSSQTNSDEMDTETNTNQSSCSDSSSISNLNIPALTNVSSASSSNSSSMCFECIVHIDDCGANSDVGIAILSEYFSSYHESCDNHNNDCCVIYCNGDFFSTDGSRSHQKNFSFAQGNLLKISVKWSAEDTHEEDFKANVSTNAEECSAKEWCNVKIKNLDSKKCIMLERLKSNIRVGFVLRKSRITIIDQYWKEIKTCIT